MTRKPTTKSPDERRLRKQLREVLQVYAADTSKFNTDATIRELLSLIDDEVRRTRMSMALTIDTRPSEAVAGAVMKSIFPTPKAWKDWAAGNVAGPGIGKTITCGGK